MHYPADSPSPEARPKGSILTPLVALLAHGGQEGSAFIRDVFEDVACDWRVVRVADGTAASRHIMGKGLPDLLIVASDLPQTSGPELIAWMRSFRGGLSVPILVWGEPPDDDAREHLLSNGVSIILPASSSRKVLADHFARMVSLVEKRRFVMPA
jgi:DNA-binding NarL/FixJ family response regulator